MKVKMSKPIYVLQVTKSNKYNGCYIHYGLGVTRNIKYAKKYKTLEKAQIEANHLENDWVFNKEVGSGIIPIVYKFK